MNIDNETKIYIYIIYTLAFYSSSSNRNLDSSIHRYRISLEEFFLLHY